MVIVVKLTMVMDHVYFYQVLNHLCLKHRSKFPPCQYHGSYFFNISTHNFGSQRNHLVTQYYHPFFFRGIPSISIIVDTFSGFPFVGPFPSLVGTSYQYWPPRSMGQPLNVNLKHIIQVVHLGGRNGPTRGGPL